MKWINAQLIKIKVSICIKSTIQSGIFLNQKKTEKLLQN